MKERGCSEREREGESARECMFVYISVCVRERETERERESECVCVCDQGILKQKLSVVIQLIPNLSNRRSTVQ